MKAVAKTKGRIIKTLPNREHGGVDVFEIMPGEKTVKWNDDKPKDPAINQVSWFQELTGSCVC